MLTASTMLVITLIRWFRRRRNRAQAVRVACDDVRTHP